MVVPPATQPRSQDIPPSIGPYTINAKLGAGGQSHVFAGSVDSRSTTVAVKWSRQPFDPPWSDPLANEFRLLNSLRHPQLTRAHDFGYAEKRAYLVVDKIDGSSLFAGITEGGFPGFWQLVRAVTPVIDFLHHRGIIHRDLKPDNFRWAGDEVAMPEHDSFLPVYLLDLGLVTKAEEDVTEKQAGTLRYMAPEVLQSEKIDQRSDLYSLGIIFFEWLTGSPPFVGNDPAAIIDAHLTSPIRWPEGFDQTEWRPVMPVVELLLAKDPAKRPASIAEFIGKCRNAGMLVREEFPRELNMPWHLQTTALSYPEIELQTLFGGESHPDGKIAFYGLRGCGANAILGRCAAESKIRGWPTGLAADTLHAGDCRIDVHGGTTPETADDSCAHCILPLRESSIRDFLTKIFFDETFVAEITPLVTEISSGLPEAITLVIQRWCEQGIISRDAGQWQFDRKRAREIAADRALRDIYQDFFAGLSAEDRVCVSYAAVFGSRFNRAILESLLEDDKRPTETLDELFATGIFIADAHDQEPQLDARFRLPGAALAWRADLPPEYRRALHRKIAAALKSRQDRWGKTIHKHLAIHHWHAEEYRPAYNAAVHWAKQNTTAEKSAEASESLDLAEKAIKHLESVDQQVLRGQVHMLRGIIAKAAGDHELARIRLLQAMAVARRTGEVRLKAEAAKHLGDTYKASHEHDKSSRVLKIALRSFRALEDDIEISHTLNNLGNAAYYRQDLDSALEYYTQALDIQERLNLKTAMASTLSNMGSVYVMQYNLPQAHLVMTDSLALKEEIGQPGEVARTLNNIGLLDILAGQYEKAITILGRAIRINESIGAGNEVLLCQTNLLEAYLWQKSYAAVFEESPAILQRAEKLRNTFYQTHVYLDLARAHFERAEYDQSERYLADAERTLAKVTERSLIEEYHLLRVDMCRVVRDQDGCEKALRAAVAAAEESGDLRNKAEAFFAAGKVTQVFGERAPEFIAAAEEARRLFEQSAGRHRIFELLLATDTEDLSSFSTEFPEHVPSEPGGEIHYSGAAEVEGLWLERWAQKFLRGGNENCAQRFFERLVEWADRNCCRESLWRAQTELGILYIAKHDYELAAQNLGRALRVLERIVKSIPNEVDRESYLSDPIVSRLQENLAAFATKFSS